LNKKSAALQAKRDIIKYQREEDAKGNIKIIKHIGQDIEVLVVTANKLFNDVNKQLNQQLL
jgi:hypothetical protein